MSLTVSDLGTTEGVGVMGSTSNSIQRVPAAPVVIAGRGGFLDETNLSVDTRELPYTEILL